MKRSLKNFCSITLSTVFLCSCALTPGMYFSGIKNSDEGQYITVEGIDSKVMVKDISDKNSKGFNNFSYRIGNGDRLYVKVWGMQDIFPTSSGSGNLNLQTVDSNGNIFFPYAGIVETKGKTTSELRDFIKLKLSKNFNDPQIDVSVIEFNSQKVYVLGEVNRPVRLNLKDTPMSLSDAIGEAKGIDTRTSEGREIFVIRQPDQGNPYVIYRANIGSPSGFLHANEFYLANNDIVYVNAKGITRWNRVITQFFPFSSFLSNINRYVDN